MDTVIRITFEDNGQDFTHWDVHRETGKVLDCQPFQYHTWCDGENHVQLSTVAVGEFLSFCRDSFGHDIDARQLKHRVAQLETVPADWLHLKNAGLPYERPDA